MSQLINGVKVPFVPIIKPEHPASKIVKGNDSFESLFRHEFDKLKFSNHATKRIESRELELTNSELARLQEAVSKAEQKGARDSLVMMNNKAFIINIPNKTVITALDVEKSEENIFTNIDSVVFAT